MDEAETRRIVDAYCVARNYTLVTREQAARLGFDLAPVATGGIEIETEWAVEWPPPPDQDPADWVELRRDEDNARAVVRRYGEGTARVVSRTVTRSPWQPAP